MDGMKCKRFFSLGLWLLVAQLCHHVPGVSGQQGVSLMFLGATIPSDSFVDFDDVLNVGGGAYPPKNHPNAARALVCLTDLVDCCAAPRTVRGDWYFPDGRIVRSFGGAYTFLATRDANDGTYQGSVRLFHRYRPSGRGRFRCELPSAANSSVNQTLYVNILNFGVQSNQDHVTTSSSGSNTVGASYFLTCSSILNSDSVPLPNNVPAPTFVWSFGPSGNDPLPTGVTDMGTSSGDNITFTSTLQFSSLSQCHLGNYTCRLGPGLRLVNSAMATVNGLSPIDMSVQITNSGMKVLGQGGYSLICSVIVTGADFNPSITYQWTKNNDAQTQVGADSVLSFSSLRLSDAGQYTCQATVSLSCRTITKMATHDVMALQIPAPTSVMLSSNIPNPIPPFGSQSVTLTCAVELSPAVDVPVTMNTVLTTPEGLMITSTAQPVMGNSTNHAATFRISPFRNSNSGVYTCSTTVSATSNAYISDSSTVIHSFRVTTGGVSISIPSDPPIAGENYTLECSAGDSEGIFQWLGPPDGRTPVVENNPRLIIITNATSSQLQLMPIQQSDNGSYSCSATTNGLTLSSELVMININAPPISVQANASGATPTAGEIHQLTCSVSGAENLNPTTTYRWTKSSDSSQIEVGTSSILSFTPLRLSDAASYACEVTISSSYLTGDIIAMNFNPQDVRIQFPTPSSLLLMSNSEVVEFGSDVTLTCTLGLNSAIVANDLSLLMVKVQLSRDGILLDNPTLSPMTGTTFVYTSRLRITDVGNYTCNATIRPVTSSTYISGSEMLESDTFQVTTVGSYVAPPVDVRATQSSSSAPVEVSWSPPSDGTDIITGYRIYYGNGKNVLVPSVTVITSVSLRGISAVQNVSIRSEANQFYSELIRVSVTMENADTALQFSSCSSEVGIVAGAIVMIAVMVLTVSVILCLWRKKSLTVKDKSDFVVSSNTAYGEVSLKPQEAEGEYEIPDAILKQSESGQVTETMATTNTYKAVDASNPTAPPEYATTEEAVMQNIVACV